MATALEPVSTYWPARYWPVRARVHKAAIAGYIMPSLTEIVRDQLGLIVSTELANQKTIADELILNSPLTPEGIQAKADVDNGIYEILDNIFIEKGTHFTQKQLPGMNIYFENSSPSQGNPVNRQVSPSMFTISGHFEEVHTQDGDVIETGDSKSAKNALRLIAMVRAIIMSGPNVRLGFDSQPRIINRRWVSSFDVLQPDFQESDGRHGNVGVLKVAVELEELGPELQGVTLESIHTAIKAKLKTSDNGKIININT